MLDGLTWRAAIAADEALLFTLFAATAQAQFASLGFAPQQLQPLLAMQFRARQADYARQFPNALDMILLTADGTPVGRHLIERRTASYRGLDLAVLPAFQNRGIGTWTLRQVQQLAALEGVPFHLRVLRTNPALRLYERLAFLRTSSDDVSYEMEWTARQHAGDAAAPIALPASGIVCGTVTLPHAEIVDRIVVFLQQIGLTVEFGPVPSSCFLPGLQLIRNGLRIDTGSLVYPGDLLHEAAHLAVMTPDQRNAEFPAATDAAQEIAALAWSYAAAIHIGLPPEVVFHPDGYKGQSSSLIEEFRRGDGCIGLPYLWWIGLTTQTLPGSPSIFPRMLRWLRAAPAPQKNPLSQELCNAL